MRTHFVQIYFTEDIDYCEEEEEEDDEAERELEPFDDKAEDERQEEITDLVKRRNKLKEELWDIEKSLSELRLKDPHLAFDVDDLTCPVCLKIPQFQIYSCQTCERAMCNVCHRKVSSCPCCRQDFKVKKAVRNRWAEKCAELVG